MTGAVTSTTIVFMAAEPWHRRQIVIAALLLLFAPLGIPLMWIRFAWTRRTKVIASVASATWFLYVIGSTAGHESSDEPAASHFSSAAPSTAREGTEGPAEPVPLLSVVPLDVGGFTLRSAEETTPCCGIHAVLTPVDAEHRGLTLVLWISKSDDKDATSDRSRASKALTVSGHPAFLDETPKLRELSIEWTDGPWTGLVVAKDDAKAPHSAAMDAAVDASSKAATLLDRYLAHTIPANEAEQRLATITKVNGELSAKQRADRVPRLLTKLRAAGVDASAVSDAAVDPLGAGDDLIVTVGSGWAAMSKTAHVELARSVWQAWVAIVRPGDADDVHIKLVDQGGNRVGGSGVMGGSVTAD